MMILGSEGEISTEIEADFTVSEVVSEEDQVVSFDVMVNVTCDENTQEDTVPWVEEDLLSGVQESLRRDFPDIEVLGRKVSYHW